MSTINFLHRLWQGSAQRFEGKKKENRHKAVLATFKIGFDFTKNQDLKPGDKVEYGSGRSAVVDAVHRVHDVYQSEEEFNQWQEMYGNTGLSWEGNEIMTVDVTNDGGESTIEKFVYEVEKVAGKQAAGPTQPKPTTDPGTGKKYIWNEEAQAWEIVDETEETVEIKKTVMLNCDSAVEDSWLVKKAVEDIFYRRRPKEVQLPPGGAPAATESIKENYQSLMEAWTKLQKIEDLKAKAKEKYEKEILKIEDKEEKNVLQTAYDGYKEELTTLLKQAQEKAYSIAGKVIALYQKAKSGEYKPTDKDRLAAVLAKIPEAQKIIDEAMAQIVKEKSKPDVVEDKPVIFPEVDTSLGIKASAVDMLKSLVGGLKGFIQALGEVDSGLSELGGVEPALASKAAKQSFKVGDVVDYKHGTPEAEEGKVVGFNGNNVNVEFYDGKTIDVSPELLTPVTGKVYSHKKGKQLGSQNRETLEESGFEVYEEQPGGDVILKSVDDGHLELWTMSDDFAGYVIEIGGKGYEFVSSIKEEDIVGSKKAGWTEELKKEHDDLIEEWSHAEDLEDYVRMKEIEDRLEEIKSEVLASKKAGISGESYQVGDMVQVIEQTCDVDPSIGSLLNLDGRVSKINGDIITVDFTEVGEIDLNLATDYRVVRVPVGGLKTRPTRKTAGKYDEVGDGKLPNKYFVQGSSYFLYAREPGSYDWVEDKISGTKVEDYGVFDTYEKAKQKAEEVISENFSDGPVKGGINNVTIEDRFTGELFSHTWWATPGKPGIMGEGGWSYEAETQEDTKFTQKKMEELGETFAYRKLGEGGFMQELGGIKIGDPVVVIETGKKGKVEFIGKNTGLMTIEFEDGTGGDFKANELRKEESLKTLSDLGLKIGEKGDVIEATSDDLILVGENDSNLYTQRFIPILKNLTLKKNRGVYDPALAPKLMRYWVDEASKLWYDANVQYYDDGSIVKKPSPAVKDEAAIEMVRRFEEDYASKAYDFMEDQTQRSFRPKKVKSEPDNPAGEPEPGKESRLTQTWNAILYINDEEVDETSIDEHSEELAMEIFLEDIDTKAKIEAADDKGIKVEVHLTKGPMEETEKLGRKVGKEEPYDKSKRVYTGEIQEYYCGECGFDGKGFKQYHDPDEDKENTFLECPKCGHGNL